jgi:hypothetical protein
MARPLSGIHSGGFDCRAAGVPWEEESAAVGKKSRNQEMNNEQ